MKIYITGCNKSGTTLLLRMFHSFKNARVITNEIQIDRFAKLKYSEDILVGKRKPKTIFSDIIDSKELNRQIKLIKKNKIVIINCIRNGEDVIASNSHIERWVKSMKQALKHIEIISLNVRYEDLVSIPDYIQKHIETIISKQAEYKFSEYPSFIPEGSYEGTFYKLRPVSTDRIDKNKDGYKLVFNEFEKLIKNY